MRVLRSVSPGRRSSHAARRIFWLAVALVLPGGAQNVPTQHETLPSPIGQRAGDTINGLGPGDPAEQEERLRALNRERQKSIVSDTNKLLKLAAELDVEVKNANPDSLTPSQLRRLAEIEKLAHKVKDKMSYSVQGPTMIATPPFQYPIR